MNTRNSLILAIALVGCDAAGDLPAYYQGGQAPQPQGLSVDSEKGNTGGQVVSIDGRNLGEDAAAITVVFGSQNAEILSAAGDELVVRVPQGPIQGGIVDVTVGTVGGQATVPGGYDYDIGEILDDQSGYILISDQWQSCLGGVGRGSAGVGCNQISYTGFTGLEGRAAFMDIKFPNVHSMYVGWAGGSDISWDQWSVQTPGQMPNSFDIENSFEDLKSAEVKGFRLTNEAWDNEDIIEDTHWCTDLKHMESYRYFGELSGDDYSPPFEVSGGSSPVAADLGTSLLVDSPAEDGTCLEAQGHRLYDRRQMNFCETHEADTPSTQDFVADWPLGRTFFVGLDENSSGVMELDETAVSNVTVDVPGLAINQSVKLPPPFTVTGTQGFNDTGVGGDFSLWGLMDLETCGDSDESGEFNLDDAVATFEWRPFNGDLSEGGYIRAARTYVKFTLNVLDIGWFGGVGSSIRATITVADDNNYDPETNRSNVEIPASVLYQFPNIDNEWGTESAVGLSSSFNWGDPLDTKFGYLVVTADRVTEYTIYTPELDGDVVFAYASGDFGFLGWENPLLEPDDCGDCSDNDGDGWTDSKDPDCRSGDYEDNASYGQYTCNDGVDNDADGDVDAADSDCEDGRDPESPECGDDIDNDGDGWTDGDDPDCTEGDGLFENNNTMGAYSCNDAVDNDGDGWTDSMDPVCGSATDDESDGFVDGVECNDGIDNDGNGDIDADDTFCVNEGPDGAIEAPVMDAECIDGVDNDEDGYVDGLDPDCEFRPYGFERKVSRDPEAVDGIDQCYDGLDNDGDGAVDAEDPGCWDSDGTPNGFIDDESLALFDGGEDEDTGDIAEDTGGE
jgi:hypothetical protein